MLSRRVLVQADFDFELGNRLDPDPRFPSLLWLCPAPLGKMPPGNCEIVRVPSIQNRRQRPFYIVDRHPDDDLIAPDLDHVLLGLDERGILIDG